MKKSELNRAVLENFILHITHSNEGDHDADVSRSYTANELYQMVDDYIKEDHVDGEGNEEDHIVTFGAESSFAVEDEDKEFPEQVVVVADFGDDEGTQTACTIDSTDVDGVNKLLEYIKDPYGKKF